MLGSGICCSRPPRRDEGAMMAADRTRQGNAVTGFADDEEFLLKGLLVAREPTLRNADG